MNNHVQGSVAVDTEQNKLALAHERKENWQRWGTYLPERQWGTVREDYSTDGNSWAYLTYEKSRYQAYRWGEDGLLGWTDRECRLCYSTSLWNGHDSHLKERLFGLSNSEGNHGEDVKELYYYLDAVPSGSYAKALYKYPHGPFPYDELLRVNQERGFTGSEYELLDTNAFDKERYFDFVVEYCKRGVDDTLIRLTLTNCGPEEAIAWVLPTVTLRNDWSWKSTSPPSHSKPFLKRSSRSHTGVEITHPTLGTFLFSALDTATAEGATPVLLTENETNVARANGQASVPGVFTKDAFDRYVVAGEQTAVRESGAGTKAALLFKQRLSAGATCTTYLRLARTDAGDFREINTAEAEDCFERCKSEADAFYETRLPTHLSADERAIARQAYAGLLWSKQFYNYIGEGWTQGSLEEEAEARPYARNSDWRHLFCRDILSVPDKWEYPWFAAWDSAFHMVSMAEIDPHFAKQQLLLLMREWYMHPNGQMASYEYAFGDVNPPVHAWAALEVYRICAMQDSGKNDTDFLERCFQKLLLNFTWWVNREDAAGRNLFSGGFLGLDNIGIFDRSKLTEGTQLQQADGTAWMGFYCLSMLNIALELAQVRSVYEDIASKFLEHYVQIVDALNGADGTGLWDEEAAFYFDRLLLPNGETKTIAIRSIVGLMPLLGITVLPSSKLDKLASFRQRLEWFLQHRPALSRHITRAKNEDEAFQGSLVLPLVPRDRLKALLAHVFDEAEFLSDFGIRSLSRFHHEHPYVLELNGEKHEVRYLPAESDNALFGGNSNWRGPIWLPINKLLLDAMEQYGFALGSTLLIEYPTGSGQHRTFEQIRQDINERVLALFRRNASGCRPIHGHEPRYKQGGVWESLLIYPEYFCGDSGRGVGASHQTGWTALVASALATSKSKA